MKLRDVHTLEAAFKTTAVAQIYQISVSQFRESDFSYLGIRQLEAIFESHVHEEGIYPWRTNKIERWEHDFNR